LMVGTVLVIKGEEGIKPEIEGEVE
jgi:hypothetical protein